MIGQGAKDLLSSRIELGRLRKNGCCVPLLPSLAPLVDAIAASGPPSAAQTVAQARARADEMADRTFRDLAHDVPPVWSEKDAFVTVPGYDVAVRIYRPRAGLLPFHVYFHGGGFWLGTLDQSDASCRRTATDTDRVVLSVAYRLAPEHQFPVPVEDCYAPVCIAAARPDLTGLPPALITTAEFDPLRDEGEAFARRLSEAGVPVRLVRWDGHFHGSFTMSKLIPDEAAAYRRVTAAALREAVPAAAPGAGAGDRST